MTPFFLGAGEKRGFGVHRLREAWMRRFLRYAREDSRGRAVIRTRSIYILPTKPGLILLFLLMIMLLGSINYGSNLAYLFTFLLGGLWLTSILHTWRNLLGLRLSDLSTSPVFAGQPAGFRLRLENPSRQDRYGISVAFNSTHADAADLPAGAASELMIRVPTTHRGPLRISRVSIHSQFPFGLFHAWTYARRDMVCLVYPTPAPWGEPPNLASYNRSESGDKGVGADDFIALRAFRQGDSPRQIDWKVMARDRGLYSRQFGGDRSETLSLDWDQLSDADPERRLSQLCRLILWAAERHQTYALKLPGTYIAAGVDEAHKQRCLAALARF